MERIIKEMAEVPSDVRGDIKATVKKILSVCEKYRSLGKKFTFEAAGIDDDVNRLLLELADQLMDDFNERIQFAIQESGDEDEAEDIMLYLGRDTDGETPQDRVDRHVSRLKYLLEALVAIGFTEGIPQGSMPAWVMQRISNQETDDSILRARRDREYSQTYIRDGDLNSQTGFAKDFVRAISVIGATMVAEAFHYGRIRNYGRMGAIGYGVQRNSSYDCPACDEVCAVVHPLSEIVLPVHPNCCCSTFPVFAGDL